MSTKETLHLEDMVAPISDPSPPTAGPGKRDNKITSFQMMVSSSIGALVTSVMVTPLDVVKVRIQTQQKAATAYSASPSTSAPCPPSSGPSYGFKWPTKSSTVASRVCAEQCICYCGSAPNGGAASTMARNLHAACSTCGPLNLPITRPSPTPGTFSILRHIIRNEGARSLWSGLPPTLVMAIPSTMLYLTVYDRMRLELTNNFNSTDGTSSSNRETDLWIPVVSGGIARCFSATAISPLELVRTKMQSAQLSYLEVVNSVRISVQTQGFMSMWRGLGPTILRDVPFSCLYWLNYEFLKKRFLPLEMRENPPFSFSFLAGAASGTLCAIVTLPFDVVKTHRQIEMGNGSLMQNELEKGKVSTLSVMRKMHKERGLGSLFSGLAPRVMKVAPACAIMISTYEVGKSFFRSYNSTDQPMTLLFSSSSYHDS